MYCPQCGHENAEGGRFCGQCGVRIKGAVAPPRPGLLARRRLALPIIIGVGALILVVLAVSLYNVSKSEQRAILGRWQEVGGTEAMEFSAGGTVTASDSRSGLSMSGKYAFLDEKHVRFEWEGLGALMGPVVVEISLSKDRLAVKMPEGMPDAGKVTTYRRTR